MGKELIGYNVIIAGSGETVYVESLKQLVCELNLNNTITFTGAVYGNENGSYTIRLIFCFTNIKREFRHSGG